jgi:riboflavin kinase/FMN adenylyltransferase
VGNFDGVHVGHQQVLGRSVDRARERGVQAVALTFVPHPVRVLAPGREPARLTPLERKLELMGESQLDAAVVLSFDRRMAALEPETFARTVLREGIGAQLVIVGTDFRFGRQRAGDVSLLARLGPELGFTVEPFHPVKVDGDRVSSSRVRQLLHEGEVEHVARLLGRPHDVAGVVVTGDQRGRTLGYPTANLGGLRALLPATGVYACWATFGGQRRMAAVNIGDRPTFGRGRSVEAYLLDFKGDLYDRELRLAFVARLRADQKFDSVEGLVAQIGRDVEKTRQVLIGETVQNQATG